MDISSFSASKIRTYKQCPFKFFLEYVLQFPPLRGGSIYSEKGKAVHEALEKYVRALIGHTDKAELDYEKTLVEYYAATSLWKLDTRLPHKGGWAHPVVKSCESCPWATKDNVCLISKKPIADTEGCPRPNFAEDLALTTKTINEGRYTPLKKKILGVEVEFNDELGGVPVKGYMDLVVEDNPETLEVVDYKTGKSMGYDAASKDPQVRIYGAIARKKWPQYKYVMVTLYYLKNKPVTIPLGPEDDLLTIEALQENARKITSDVDPARIKTGLCDWCVTYDGCGKIQKALRLNGKFRLPTIECSYSGQDGACHGTIYAVENQNVTCDSALSIQYSCAGHKEIPTGGKYLIEAEVKAAKEKDDA